MGNCSQCLDFNIRSFKQSIVSDTYVLLNIPSLDEQKYIITRVHPFTWMHRPFFKNVHLIFETSERVKRKKKEKKKLITTIQIKIEL